MFTVFKKKVTRLLGVDIGATSIRLVELSFEMGVYVLEGYAIEFLPRGAVVEKNIMQIEVVGQALGRALRKLKTSLKEVVIAIPSSAVILKNIELPRDLSETTLDGLIKIEANQFIPYPLEEVAIDYYIPKEQDLIQENMTVILAACRKENIECRQSVLFCAGLRAKVVDVELYALERVCALIYNRSKSEKILVMIEVDVEFINLNVIENNSIIYTRESIFNYQKLDDFNNSVYWMECLYKKEINEEFIIEMTQSFKELLFQQITRSLQFFFTLGRKTSVDSIILIGIGAVIPELDKFLSEKINVPVYIANPFSGMRYGRGIDVEKLNLDAPALMTACGLAMRELN